MNTISAINHTLLSQSIKDEFAVIEGQIGFVPNLFSYIANSSNMLHAFFSMSKAFDASSFNASEREIIQLTTSQVNRCQYCLAGHSYFAHLQGIDESLIAGIVSGKGITDTKYSALYTLCKSMVSSRGDVALSIVNDFFAQGYTQAQFIELTMGIAIKTFTNLVSKVANIEIDEKFAEFTAASALEQSCMA